ncbi:hypothetical protein N825_00980 [Skermanella stibiiresistens SB22]|uniref:Uncharacterized protein n=1 Tax=Skermanella stibiiresistens SB22 TaxID=1385369 RepID=W9HDM1_9PROT|nr:hypothetical protein N825_00980 [Skermanella stibiiresistens SB22]
MNTAIKFNDIHCQKNRRSMIKVMEKTTSTA